MNHKRSVLEGHLRMGIGVQTLGRGRGQWRNRRFWRGTRSLAFVMVFGAVFLFGGFKPPKPAKPPLTVQDVNLRVEALEARVEAYKCQCGADNDQFAKQFAKTLKEAGIPTLPGVKR